MGAGVLIVIIMLIVLGAAVVVVVLVMVGSSDDDEDDGTGPGKPIWPVIAIIGAIMVVIFGGLAALSLGSGNVLRMIFR